MFSSSTEIIKEVKQNGNKLSELLESGVDQLEPNCLNEALIAAVHNDHHQNVGILVKKGASKILEALQLSVNEKKVYASAMLMLIYSAKEGNCNLIRQLFGEIRIDDQPCQECSRPSGGAYALISRMLDKSAKDEDCRDSLESVCRALKGSDTLTAIPIEIAQRNVTGKIAPERARRCAHVRQELLMKTGVSKDDKSVQWQGLSLNSVELTWLKRIDWVDTLLMGRNQLRVLPSQMGLHLQQVC